RSRCRRPSCVCPWGSSIPRTSSTTWPRRSTRSTEGRALGSGHRLPDPRDEASIDRGFEGAVSARTIACRVLVVDDDPEVRAALHDMLADYGFDVVGLAEDGLVGVAAAHELRPDVVLMDIRMPGKNGIDATREILAEVPGVRVIALSAYDDPALAAAAASAGARAYIVKGTAPELICDRIEEVRRSSA